VSIGRQAQRAGRARAAGLATDRIRDVARWIGGRYAGRVAVITAAGLGARLALIWYQPLWRDEAFTAVAVGRPVGQMLQAVRGDSAPPLAYLVDHGIASFWASPAGLRVLPALAGTAAVPIGAALGRRIGGDRAGVAAAAICAAAPALVLSSLDARMYAIATTLVMAATLALWRALERATWRRFAVYALLMTLALYTDYFAILAIPAQLLAGAFVLRAGRRASLAAAVAAAAAAVALAPWLVFASPQLTHAGHSFWVPPLGFTSVSGAFVQFFSGPPVDPWVPLKPLLQTLQGLAVTAGVVMCFELIRQRRDVGGGGRRAALFCVTCGLGAVLLLLPISIWRPLVDGRYASVVWGPLFPVLGAGLAMFRIRWMIAGGVAATAAASLALAFAATHPDTRSAVSALEARTAAHDLVDAYPSQYLLFLYYAPPNLLSRTRVVEQDVPWFWGTAAYPTGVITPTLPRDVASAGGAVYYVRQPDEPPASLPSGYFARSTQCWTGVCVVTYTR